MSTCLQGPITKLWGPMPEKSTSAKNEKKLLRLHHFLWCIDKISELVLILLI